MLAWHSVRALLGLGLLAVSYGSVACSNLAPMDVASSSTTVVSSADMPAPRDGWYCYEARVQGKIHTECGPGLDGCRKAADHASQSARVDEVGTCSAAHHLACTHLTYQGEEGGHLCYATLSDCSRHLGAKLLIGAMATQTECREFDL